MRIAKKQKNKYDICISWFKANKDDIDNVRKVSLFPFLNWHDEAKCFADYCKSINEDEIANKATETWDNL